MEAEKAEKFEAWAIVELFGHQQLAGRVSEATIAGGAFIRVDVPEQPARAKVHAWDSDEGVIPAYTRYFSPGAIYAINPCSEDIATRAAAGFRKTPPLPFTIPTRPALNAPGSGDD